MTVRSEALDPSLGSAGRTPQVQPKPCDLHPTPPQGAEEPNVQRYSAVRHPRAGVC